MKQRYFYVEAGIFEEEASSKVNVVIDSKGRFHTLHLDRELTARDIETIRELEGIECSRNATRYSLEFSIGRAFNTEEVLNRVKEAF